MPINSSNVLKTKKHGVELPKPEFNSMVSNRLEATTQM